MTNVTATPPATFEPRLADITKAIAKRSFCTLATTSPSNEPHVAAVLYVADGTTLYVHTRSTSRKARNVASNERGFVCIPVRRLPVGPPSSIQFAATVELLEADDPSLVARIGDGTMKPITSHGELDDPDGCFLRITPTGTLHTYGLGMSIYRLVKDPINAAGRVSLD
jgi:general stress protein 26